MRCTAWKVRLTPRPKRSEHDQAAVLLGDPAYLEQRGGRGGLIGAPRREVAAEGARLRVVGDRELSGDPRLLTLVEPGRRHEHRVGADQSGERQPGARGGATGGSRCRRLRPARSAARP
jgi:hypothetical protein